MIVLASPFEFEKVVVRKRRMGIVTDNRFSACRAHRESDLYRRGSRGRFLQARRHRATAHELQVLFPLARSEGLKTLPLHIWSYVPST